MISSHLFAVLLTTTPATIDQWVCTRTESTGAPQFASGIFTFDAIHGAFSFKTKERTATGFGEVGAEAFRGQLNSENGLKLVFELNRITGEFRVLRQGSTRTDYVGRCSKSISLSAARTPTI